ncbi:unnamed protein product [Lampetra fluviatilis]
MCEAAECNIRVVCRVRPLNEAEQNRGDRAGLRFQGHDTVLLGGKAFAFDRVFPPEAGQAQVYAECARQIVKDVLQGYNGTIFAYGQTSSGKTHTMEQQQEEEEATEAGIIPRIVDDVFSHIDAMDHNLEFHLKVSYFEIYMEKVRDLIDVTKGNLSVHEDKHGAPYVKGCTELFVSSPEEVLEIIHKGKANRHVAVTNMNEHSSRSHSILLLHVKQQHVETMHILSGKLYLVDLAGSEKVSKTLAEGAVLDEAKNINRSLSALGNVISSLAEGNKSHIPYRDSKMTRILKDSLGGNCRTIIVICCSPSSYNEAETKSTLFFGQRAKTIKNTACVNVELTGEEWRKRFEKERRRRKSLWAHLQRAEAELERWRAGQMEIQCEKVAECDWCHVRGEAGGLGTSTSESGVVTPGDSGLTEALRQAYEEQIRKLYQNLDNKEEEYNQQAQLVERLNKQMLDQDELLACSRREAERQQAELSRLQADGRESRDEMAEVLRSMDELAAAYDAKSAELDQRGRESQTLHAELQRNTDSLALAEGEILSQQELVSQERRRMADSTLELLRELSEITSSAGGKESPWVSAVGFGGEEELCLAHLGATRVKSEVKALARHCLQLGEDQRERKRHQAETERELSTCRLIVAQLEASVGSLTEVARVEEQKKHALEETCEQLQQELVRLRTQEKMHEMSFKDKEKKHLSMIEKAIEMKVSVVEELRVLAERHQEQLGRLRQEGEERQRLCEQLKSVNGRLELELEQIRGDCERLRAAELDKSSQLHEINEKQQRLDLARHDLRELERTVIKELQSLYNLRRALTHELAMRIRKSTVESSGASGKRDQRGVVIRGSAEAERPTSRDDTFQIENVNRIHKQVLENNIDLHKEVPRLRSRASTVQRRVSALKLALQEAREARRAAPGASGPGRDEAAGTRVASSTAAAIVRRINFPQIVKPIRPGQKHTPTRPLGQLRSMSTPFLSTLESTLNSSLELSWSSKADASLSQPRDSLGRKGWDKQLTEISSDRSAILHIPEGATTLTSPPHHFYPNRRRCHAKSCEFPFWNSLSE